MFSILTMRSGPAPRPDEDLHVRARIRNAAIHRFGADGFAVGLRAIAEDAGVSPALILRYYGTKDGLRAACDEHVLRLIRESKSATVATGSPTAILAQLADTEEFGSAALYVVASLLAGGPLAVELFEHMVADASENLATAEANGVIRPSLDPVARARYLTLSGVGAMLLELRLGEHDPHDIAGFMAKIEHSTMVPALELYTHGLFTDASILDALLAAGRGATPERAAAGESPHAPAPHDVATDPPTV